MIKNQSSGSQHLDLIRGLAALVVFLGHLRFFFFLPYHSREGIILAERMVYFVTGFTHEAVVIFFVLSGFFISSSVMRLTAKGEWQWKNYVVNRCTRLYVVLIPGLILTAFWDWVGVRFFPATPIYVGSGSNVLLNYPFAESS